MQFDIRYKAAIPILLILAGIKYNLTDLLPRLMNAQFSFPSALTLEYYITGNGSLSQK
jgi:hypothetical protein